MSKTGNPAEIARLIHLVGAELGLQRVQCPHLLLALERRLLWLAAGFAQCDADTTALFDNGVRTAYRKLMPLA